MNKIFTKIILALLLVVSLFSVSKAQNVTETFDGYWTNDVTGPGPQTYGPFKYNTDGLLETATGPASLAIASGTPGTYMDIKRSNGTAFQLVDLGLDCDRNFPGNGGTGIINAIVTGYRGGVAVTSGVPITIVSVETTFDFTTKAGFNNVDEVKITAPSLNVFIEDWAYNLSLTPVTTSGYPKTSNITGSSVQLTNNLNETGTTYYVVLPSTAAAPNATQIKAGQDATGATASINGSYAITAATTDVSTTISGLTASTSYKVYVASTDDNGNLQGTAGNAAFTTTSPTITVPGGTITLPSVAAGPRIGTPASFNISASNLSPASGTITITAPSNVDVSPDGSSFSPSYSYNYTGGAVSATIYAALTGTGTPGTISGNVSISAGGATATQAVSGTLTPAPAITVPGGTTTLTATTSGTAGTSSSFNISASALSPASGNLTITAPTNVQVSPDGSTWGSSYTVAYTSGALASTTVNVRLAGTGTAGTITGNVSVSGGGATTVTQAISGTLNAPAPTVTTQTANGVTTSQATLHGTVNDNGLNTSMGFVYGTDPTLTNNNLAPSTPSSISANSGSTGITSTVSGLAANQTYYFQAYATNNSGTTFGSILSFTTGATAAITVPGGTTPLISTSSGTPGASVSFNLTGSNLSPSSGTFTVTAPGNIEVSLNNSTWGSSATNTYVSANPAIVVYVRLAGTGTLGTISGNVTISAGGATATQSVSGTLTAPPAITVAGGTITLPATTPTITGASTSFNISASNLTPGFSNLIVTAPSDVQISPDGSTWSSSYSIAYSAGTLASTAVKVRLAGTGSPGTISGNVSVSGGGATTVNQAVSGTLNSTYITNVTSSVANGAYKTGSVIPIQLVFSSPVTLTGGSMLLNLATGSTTEAATYVSGSGSNTLTLNYTVHAGDSANLLDYVATNPIIFISSGIIKDLNGNMASVALPAPGAAGSLSANKSIVIDGIAPTALALSNNTINDSGAISGATIGTLSATDANSITYALATGNGTNDADNGKFAISGTTLKIGASALAAGTYQINVSATDVAGNVTKQAFTITVISTAESLNVSGTITAETSTYGSPSAAQSFTVNGSNVSSNITVTAPAGFAVSTDNVTYNAAVTLTPVSGTISSAPVYVRLKSAAAAGSYSGSVTLAVNGVTLASESIPSSTVSPAPLTITANNQTKVYGAALPTLTASYSGFQNGDTQFTLSAPPTLTTAANAASHVAGSPYAITASGAVDPNYTFTYVAGALTVTPAPLTITANSQSKVYGDPLPTLTAGYSGFVNGDNALSLTSPPSLTTTANALSSVAGSPYTITAHGAADADYAISYVAGSLTVTPAPLTITADNQTKAYGAPVPTLTASYSGFVNGDNVTKLTTAPTLTTTATTASTVAGSPYAITVGGAVDANYAITYAAGSLTVTQAPLTITANDQTKAYGAPVPTLTASYSGFVNGDDATKLTSAPTLSTTATTASTVAGSPYAITAGGAVDANYAITYAAGSLTVTKAPLTITANDQTKAYGAPVPTLTAGYSGFVNGDDATKLTTAPTLTTTVTTASTVAGSPYVITAGGAVDDNYTITYAAGSLTVTTAPLTITADNVFKLPGTTLTGGAGSTAFTSNGLQNSQTIGSVTITYGSGAAANAASGTYNGSVVASAAIGGSFTASNYAITYVAGNITVNTSAINTSGTLAAFSATYGTASAAQSFSVSGSNLSDNILVSVPTRFEVSTNASTGFASTLTLTQTGGTVSATTVYIRIAAGTVPATYSGSVSLGSTGAATQTVSIPSSTVSKAPLTITADNKTKAYGAVLPTLTASYSGFVNGENSGSLTTLPTLTTTATSGSSVVGGPYAITASGAVDANYSISYVAGSLSVTKVPLTITANNQTKTYGAALPTLTASYSGFVNGDDANSLTTAPSLTTTATAASSVNGGPYAITASGAADANYTISYVAGSLTVNAAQLTITTDNKTKVYGDALPTLTASYNGFVNGDDAASLTTAPSLTTTATSDSPVNGGPYAIAASGAADANYNISYVPGTLTVTTKAVAVTANAQSKTYGDVDPALTYTFSPALVAGDSFTGTLSRTAGENAGSYAINQGTLSLNSNYTINYTNANLTIGTKTINVIADAKTKVYGDVDPALTYTFSPALIGADSFTGALSRTAGENAGSYAINQGTLSLNSNYTINSQAPT